MGKKNTARWQENGCPLCRPLDGRPCEKHAPKSSPLRLDVFPSAYGHGRYVAIKADGILAPMADMIQDEKFAALIVRRVKQGPAFDAMERALSAALVAIECGGHEKAINRSNPMTVEAVRAALKLAQEAR